VASTVLLSLAARSLPIGTAYAVWLGIRAVGAVVLGTLLFGEPGTPGRLSFLALRVVSIAGLKLATPAPGPATRAPTEIVE
jgi:quaternary ammonium compound-resistance protein SugE